MVRAIPGASQVRSIRMEGVSFDESSHGQWSQVPLDVAGRLVLGQEGGDQFSAGES